MDEQGNNIKLNPSNKFAHLGQWKTSTKTNLMDGRTSKLHQAESITITFAHLEQWKTSSKTKLMDERTS